MAPEQVRCEAVDERTDVYALGVMLFQLLTGQFPFQADDPHRVALLHLTAPIPRPSLLAAVSPALDSVVLRCMAKQPGQRFASVADLLVALRAALREHEAEATTSGRALAVHIALVMSDQEELDEGLLEGFMNLLDEAEAPLLEASFVLLLRTASALLAVRVLDGDAAQELSLEQLATQLCERIREQARAKLHVRVQAHASVGSVELRSSEQGVEVVGGALLDIASWQPSGPSGI
jgi:serine/threonine-protein kinase